MSNTANRNVRPSRTPRVSLLGDERGLTTFEWLILGAMMLFGSFGVAWIVQRSTQSSSVATGSSLPGNGGGPASGPLGPTSIGPAPPPMTKAEFDEQMHRDLYNLDFRAGFDAKLREGMANGAHGLAFMAMHPLDTGMAIGSGIKTVWQNLNWEGASSATMATWNGLRSFGNGTLREKGEMLGSATGELAVTGLAGEGVGFVVGRGAAAVVSKVAASRVAEGTVLATSSADVAGQVAARTAAAAARGAEVAAEAGERAALTVDVVSRGEYATEVLRTPATLGDRTSNSKSSTDRIPQETSEQLRARDFAAWQRSNQERQITIQQAQEIANRTPLANGTTVVINTDPGGFRYNPNGSVASWTDPTRVRITVPPSDGPPVINVPKTNTASPVRVVLAAPTSTTVPPPHR